MLHLHAERLAALADEAPTPLEMAHLECCPHCAGEVGAYRRLLERAAASRTTLPGPAESAASEPLNDWSSLVVRLRGEGLLPPAEVVHFPVSGEFRAARRPRLWRRTALRAAAALLFVSGGAMVGRVSAGESPLPKFVGSTGVASAALPEVPGSEREALLLMAEAELQYRQAAAYLASMEEASGVPNETEVLQTRLAALDEVGAVTREALQDAPHDPVINQYYLASQGARAATIRQIDRMGTPAMLVGSY